MFSFAKVIWVWKSNPKHVLFLKSSSFKRAITCFSKSSVPIRSSITESFLRILFIYKEGKLKDLDSNLKSIQFLLLSKGLSASKSLMSSSNFTINLQCQSTAWRRQPDLHFKGKVKEISYFYFTFSSTIFQN